MMHGQKIIEFWNTFNQEIYIKIPNYSIYDTQHPDGTARGGTAIITNGIKHHLHGHYNLEHLQASSVNIEDWVGPLTIAVVYCPKHAIKAEQFLSFGGTLVQRFLAGGDYNAKHCHWGSRLFTPKGPELFKAMHTNNLIWYDTIYFMVTPCIKQCWNLFLTNWCT